jgi:two-component system phosphate regulon response regulator PhoB
MPTAVRGLDVGADDYVTKPFSITELMARVKALLRRARPARDAEVLRYADLELDIARHRVTRNGRPIHLGPTEFRLLRFLMERPGRVYSPRAAARFGVGPRHPCRAAHRRRHIRRLRRALNAQEDTDLIRTVRAAGYALDTSAA